MNGFECEHLADLKEDDLKIYKLIYTVFVVSSRKDSKCIKLRSSYCHVCKQMGPLLHACLQCVFFGCHKHIQDHMRRMDHCFSMELNYGQIYCARCNDYIYTTKFDNIQDEISSHYKSKKLFPINWSFMVISDEEANYLQKAAHRICITPDAHIGVRGLYNMGNTCYMNSVMQCFLHTPILREYFLSQQHHCKVTVNNCVACEISRLFQEFYNGNYNPVALNNLLYLIWTHAHHMRGAIQHDAQEYLLTLIQLIHRQINGIFNSTDSDNISNCSCIIEDTFSGYSQTEYMCQKCKNLTMKLEKISILPLSLNADKSSESLDDCFERFTRLEDIQDVNCAQCGVTGPSTSASSLKTVPNILSVQLKRFGRTEEENTKISSFVAFPEIFDASPFTTKKNHLIQYDNNYTLFAVISHEGDTPGFGHYIAYVRHKNDIWYYCNDDKIKRVTIDEVLKTQAYLLFYYRNKLRYS